MHLPKLSLRTGSLRGFRGRLGQRMYLRQREMTEDKAKLVLHDLLDFLDDHMGRSAVRTLEVAILDQSHRRSFRSLYVIALAHRHRKLCPRASCHGPPSLPTGS